MTAVTQIVFEDMAPSDAVETAAANELEKLEKYFDGIVRARVVISEPHRHHHQGSLFAVRITLAVPGEELVISHEHPKHAAHQDVYVAMHEAFNAMRRKLEDYVRRMRLQVKTHDQRPRGHIVRVEPWNDHGFIQADDGRELYFHRNSLLSGDFEQLHVNDAVSFIEEPGDKGPIAKSVRIE